MASFGQVALFYCFINYYVYGIDRYTRTAMINMGRIPLYMGIIIGHTCSPIVGVAYMRGGITKPDPFAIKLCHKGPRDVPECIYKI